HGTGREDGWRAPDHDTNSRQAALGRLRRRGHAGAASDASLDSMIACIQRRIRVHPPNQGVEGHMPDVARVRRRVAAALPPRWKERIARLLGRGPARLPHARLVVRHEDGRIVYEGELHAPARARALVVRPESRLSTVVLRIEQEASTGFCFWLDPAELWRAAGGDGRYDLFLEVDGAGSGPTETRLGCFDHTE